MLIYEKSTCICTRISIFFFSWYGAHRDLHSFPTRRSSDLIGILAAGIRGGEVLEEEVRIARDRREDVVEVVRDAARQPAHRFHLLGLPQLLLELNALRDIAPDSQDTD